MLTPAAVRAAAPGARAAKLFDGGGLFLHVAPTGTKTFRLKYRKAGREQLLVLGRYPAIGLAEARALRDTARADLAAGRAPTLRSAEADTFAQIARAWHQDQITRWSAAHAVDVLASLERDVFPAIGERPITAITAPELLNVLRLVEQRGCGQTAKRLRERLSAVFGYAIALGLAESDPAEKLGRALRPAPIARPQPALTTIDDCRALLAAADLFPGAGKMVRLAHRFLALTAVRLDAVRGARWSEIEDLDGTAPVWRVPAARMKLARAKKGEARFDHLLPLSPVAVAVLRKARLISAASFEGEKIDRLIFPGSRPDKPIGENAIRNLVSAAGFAGRHVPHGWRASFSTILNEDLGDGWRSAIDAALAHSVKDKVEGAYNRSVQLERRRQLLNRWGELLTG